MNGLSFYALSCCLIKRRAVSHSCWHTGLRDSCPEVGAEVVAAIRQWRYEPARLKGKAVPICMTVRTGIEVR